MLNEEDFLFLSVYPGKIWDSTLNSAMIASLHILSSTLYTNHPMIQCYIVLT
jgi:hypothetical protein